MGEPLSHSFKMSDKKYLKADLTISVLLKIVRNLGSISGYPWYFLLLIVEEILEFSTTKNSSPEIIEGIFREEI